MNISEAIRTRRTIRAFKSDPIPKETLEAILDTARWSGSGMNTQPWELVVFGGEKMEELRNRLSETAGPGKPSKMEFSDGRPLPEAFNKRADAYREASSSYSFPPGTEDLEAKRQAQMAIRSRLNNAPNIIVICTDKYTLNWPWGLMALGIMAQSICLAAMDHGLTTSIISAPASQPGIVRELSGLPETMTAVSSVALGYPDPEARINNYPRSRRALDEFVHWVGF